jgi:hypothetical protein
VRITILDACGSGAIVRAKGGERRPAFLMDESSNMKGTAFLTSSTASEVSQESDRLKASFFTHALVTGLRGAADLNNDKKVTLSEAYQFAFQETLNRTEKTTGGTQHPSRDMNLSGSGDVVLTDLRGISTGCTLNKDLQGRFYFRDDQGQLIAELHKSAGREIEIGLSPGIYQVRMELDNIYETRVTLASGGHEYLGQNQFKVLATEKTRYRGRCSECEQPWHEELEGKPAVNDLQFAITKSDTAFRGMQLSGFLNQANRGIIGNQISIVGANLAPQGYDGMQLSATLNYSGEFAKGVQISGALNIADELSGVQGSYINYANKINGIQAGFTNITKNNVNGVQGGFINVGADSLRGVQGGFINVNTGPSNGVQGGFTNISGWGQGGLQGGFLNVAGTQSLQVGFLNVADSVSMQVGFLNIANDCKLPIGFISFSRKGLYGVRGTLDETHWKQRSVFSGSPLLYTAFFGGQNTWRHSSQQSIGYGVGTHFGMNGPLWLQLEWSSHLFLLQGDANPFETEAHPFSMTMHSPVDDYSVRNQLTFDVGYNITSFLGISVGTSVNVQDLRNTDAYSEPFGSWQADIGTADQPRWLWTGFHASIVIGRLGKGFI